MAVKTHAAKRRLDPHGNPFANLQAFTFPRVTFPNPFGPQLVFWQPEKGKLPVYIGERHFDGEAVEVKHWGEVVHVDREIARYVADMRIGAQDN